MPRLPVIHPGKSVKLHSDPRSLKLFDHLAACGVLAVMSRPRNSGILTTDEFALEHPDPSEPAGYWLEIQFREAAIVATDRRGWRPAGHDGDQD
jgi:hypothetical protein